MKNLYIKTYGCEMNIYDSQKMAALLSPWGYQVSADYTEAEMVIINTCHIREKASEKLYSDLGRINKIKKKRQAEGKDLFLIVAGCVAQAHGAEVYRQAPFVDLVVGPQAYHQIPTLLSQAQHKKELLLNNNVVKAGMGIIATDFPLESKFDFLPEESMGKGPSGQLQWHNLVSEEFRTSLPKKEAKRQKYVVFSVVTLFLCLRSKWELE